jgi:hypothetical protein
MIFEFFFVGPENCTLYKKYKIRTTTFHGIFVFFLLFYKNRNYLAIHFIDVNKCEEYESGNEEGKGIKKE